MRVPAFTASRGVVGGRVHAVGALLGLVLVLVLVAGCATAPPPSPATGLTQPFDPPAPANLGRGPGTVQVEEIGGPYNMYVTESIRSVCAGPAPFFAFDSSKPTSSDQPTMKNLIECMIAGPLLGRTIKLTGHTDPRGTAGFNEDLGLHGAEVKTFLVANGVEQGRIETASLGAKDAAQEPKEWPEDRRVQIELVP